MIKNYYSRIAKLQGGLRLDLVNTPAAIGGTSKFEARSSKEIRNSRFEIPLLEFS